MLNKSVYPAILLSGLIFSGLQCKHASTHWKITKDWEKLVEQERNQPGAVSQLDNAVIDYMKKYNVPGLSIAVAKDDKLIYVKGYGYADVTTHEKVTTESLFRLASVSKPVTAIAIMKLVQDGKCSLSAKVFGNGGILGNDFGEFPPGSFISQITVDELLHHTSGGWPTLPDAPLELPWINPRAYTRSQLIAWTLKKQPLTEPPGNTYAYSNFGFVLLGRIIEKLSGQNYDEYVIANVLRPAGITDMQTGGNSTGERRPREVVYYEENDEPYIYDMAMMDAGAGWIASAKDLLQLIVSVDGLHIKKALLTDSITKLMLTPSKVNPQYACGWRIATDGKQVNWYHFGELMGTATLLAHTQAGFSWAILTNTGYQNDQNHTDLDQLLWKAISDSTTHWPDKDLF